LLFYPPRLCEILGKPGFSPYAIPGIYLIVLSLVQ
jgi:hypothetical protein